MFLAERHHAQEANVSPSTSDLRLQTFIFCFEMLHSRQFVPSFLFLRQAVVVHECTAGFMKWILLKYLPQYQWHTLIKVTDPASGKKVMYGAIDDATTDAYLLNPGQFGWPLNRPRLFSVGTLTSKCFLQPKPNGESGLSNIGSLFVPCRLDCRSLFVAPKDTRTQMCVRKA